ncbi:MAG: OsmC family protein [Acidobacteria bacterium]|nr:OsmC family protein [Acidobacteriota bacterium]
MDLRSIQKPLKEKYRSNPNSSRITLRAHSSQTESPISCSVEVGQKVLDAQAHSGVGGPGTAACSGDLLLGALAACAQLTCQLVATAMGIPVDNIRVEVEGQMDLSGTLGISPEVPVGFQDIHARFQISAPQATAEQLANLKEKTEKYCVVMRTLAEAPAIRTSWAS